MKTRIISLLLFLCVTSYAQNPSFDVTAYKQFLQSNQNLTTGGLLTLYPAGSFQLHSGTLPTTPLFLDSISQKYNLTAYELNRLQEHGFMVSERLSDTSFADAYLDVWKKDLPVFISTDAILHALHTSYDAILKDVEITVLIPKLEELLTRLHGQLGTLASTYANNPEMTLMLKDVDVYLTVPRKLFDQSVMPYYPENASDITALLNYIQNEQPADYPLFASVQRTIDFSQFKVRGHYTDSYYPQLGKYFKAMMWLGRTEIYLIPPQSIGQQPTMEDIQRQIIDAVLLREATSGSNSLSLSSQIDSVIRFFVGESDNVTLPNLQTLMDAVNIASADQLLDTTITKRFQDSLATKSYAFQRILSQILFNDPMNPDSIRPASAFMLFGQRFIIDSYITGQVIYDKILYNGARVTRMLPSTLDILFALGNDGAVQLLQSELDTYNYGSNLAAARYLVDSYDSTFWQSSLFNLWLNCIRNLNPPQVRDSLPPFMQTAAWWQEKMNTQLASWSELRHDNLLYAKQSYTGGATCSFPYGYVEPIPAFYNAVKVFASIAEQKFQSIPFTNASAKQRIVEYYHTVRDIADTLGRIAQKELAQTPLSLEENNFMKRMVSESFICAPFYNGWYYSLYYEGDPGFTKKDYIVADVHTAPTDASGNMVGWVVHAGTGPINLGVFVAQIPSGQTVAFVGPAMNYREFTSTNFLRLSDEEWKNTYLASSTRSSFVNLYLADNAGESRGIGANLFMSPNGIKEPKTQPSIFTLNQNYPNPFNGTTLISVHVPSGSGNNPASLKIYTITGQNIRTMFNSTLQAGNYLFRWDGKNDQGIDVASGIYMLEFRAGDVVQAKKMSLIR